MSGISVLLKETPEISLTHSEIWKRAVARTQLCWCHDLGLSVFRTVRNKFVLFITSQSIVIQPEPRQLNVIFDVLRAIFSFASCLSPIKNMFLPK
jgi:hypothetical protein